MRQSQLRKLAIVFSDQLRDTLQSLKRLSDRSISRGQLIAFTETEEASRGGEDSIFSIIQDILGDPDRNASAPYALRSGQANINRSKLAALSITIEVTEA